VIDLAFDDGQQAIAGAVRQFCNDRCDADRVKALAGRFPRELWGELAELGMLAIATPEGEGGALEVVAAAEALGAFVFPGPVIESFLAGQVLEEGPRVAVADGTRIVCAGAPPLVAWACDADLFLELAAGEVYEARLSEPPVAVETLGGEPWGRVRWQRARRLEAGARAIALGEIAHAAYQGAAGQALIEAASKHARTRNQFGRAIGEFQAVAHPLADCAMDLAAAGLLARRAAFVFDETDPHAGPPVESIAAAAAARASADRAALQAVYVAHQVFGAIGITLEGPAFHITRRIRQLASQRVREAGRDEGVLQVFGVAPLEPAPGEGRP